MLGHAETLPLYDRASGEAAGRYTTKTVRAQEQAALADAAAVAGARHHRALPAAAIDAAVAVAEHCGPISASPSTMRLPAAG